MQGKAESLRFEKLGKLLLSYSLPAIIATSAASLPVFVIGTPWLIL